MISAAALCAAAAPAAVRAEPFRPGDPPGLELGLFGHSTPDVLKRAKSDPYAAPAAPACESIPREIAELDRVLGPDADAPLQKTKMTTRANRLLGRAVRGFIPHRDVVRFVTGADRKDKALNDAAMAGWARRGFLKGMEVNLGCPGAATKAETGELQQTAAVAETAEPVLLPQIPPAEISARSGGGDGDPLLVHAFAPEAKPAAQGFAR